MNNRAYFQVITEKGGKKLTQTFTNRKAAAAYAEFCYANGIGVIDEGRHGYTLNTGADITNAIDTLDNFYNTGE
tara:strand:+ start:784 stop:1005 length:222 start_codon:yes stop_codon:yes gene_type:complete